MKLIKYLLIIFLGFSIVHAQYMVKHSSFSNAGTEISNAAYGLKSIAGQNLVGQSTNDIYIANSGFVPYIDPLITGLIDPFSDLPESYGLYQNYPNPFNPATSIKFALPEAQYVKIDIYNILGQHLATLLDDNKPAGFHIVTFNAGRYSSGMYFYTIQAGSYFKVMKMMVIK